MYDSKRDRESLEKLWADVTLASLRYFLKILITGGFGFLGGRIGAFLHHSAMM